MKTMFLKVIKYQLALWLLKSIISFRKTNTAIAFQIRKLVKTFSSYGIKFNKILLSNRNKKKDSNQQLFILCTFYYI